MFLLLTQTRVSVEESHGSRFLQQVERKALKSLREPFFLQIKLPLKLRFAVTIWLERSSFEVLGCLDWIVCRLCVLYYIYQSCRGPGLLVCCLIRAIWSNLCVLNQCASGWWVSNNCVCMLCARCSQNLIYFKWGNPYVSVTYCTPTLSYRPTQKCVSTQCRVDLAEYYLWRARTVPAGSDR